jgi:hypothetical protein
LLRSEQSCPGAEAAALEATDATEAAAATGREIAGRGSGNAAETGAETGIRKRTRVILGNPTRRRTK